MRSFLKVIYFVVTLVAIIATSKKKNSLIEQNSTTQINESQILGVGSDEIDKIQESKYIYLLFPNLENPSQTEYFAHFPVFSEMLKSGERYPIYRVQWPKLKNEEPEIDAPLLVFKWNERIALAAKADSQSKTNISWLGPNLKQTQALRYSITFNFDLEKSIPNNFVINEIKLFDHENKKFQINGFKKVNGLILYFNDELMITEENIGTKIKVVDSTDNVLNVKWKFGLDKKVVLGQSDTSLENKTVVIDEALQSISNFRVEKYLIEDLEGVQLEISDIKDIK